MAGQMVTDATGPLGGLPAARPVLLGAAQIDVALVEVRFVAAQSELSTSDALLVRQSLADAQIDLPRMQPAQQQQVTVAMGPAGSAAPHVQVSARGWQFAAADGQLTATVLPGAIAVQCTRYVRWSESLSPAVSALLEALMGVMAPELVSRIGVRYINRLVDEGAQAPQAWLGRINPAVLGVVSEPVLGASLVSSQQQFELRFDDDHGALVRHGTFVDGASRGAYSYLLDLDVFDTASTAFVPDDIVQRARGLNRAALALFQQIVTQDYRDTMDPYAELDEAGAVISGGEAAAKATSARAEKRS